MGSFPEVRSEDASANRLRGEVQAATSERHGPLDCDAVGGFV